MVKFKSSQPVSSPSSALGIMRFFDDTSGPKMTPEFVMVLVAAIVIVMIVLNALA